MNTNAANMTDRYERQIRLKEIGAEGQMKLKEASVLVIGAGGIGCPLLSYLCAAGIGKIGIVDFDKVNITNLHRQVLYNETQTGMYKTEAALENLIRLNSETEFGVFNTSIGKSNGCNIIREFDIVADATDRSSGQTEVRQDREHVATGPTRVPTFEHGRLVERPTNYIKRDETCSDACGHGLQRWATHNSLQPAKDCKA